MQFRQDYAALLQSPRFDSHERSFFQTRAEFPKWLCHLIQRERCGKRHGRRHMKALIVGEEVEPRMKVSLDRSEEGLAGRLCGGIE